MRQGLSAALFLLLLAAAPAPGLETPSFSLGYARETTWSTGDAALDGLQAYLRPTLEANRKEFIGRSGSVKAFGAGTHYPQVWIRDSATLLPLSRHHYPREFLVSWIVEHLAHQGPDGLLNDWVAVGEKARFQNDAPHVREVVRRGAFVMSADRNTSSADQESALVDAAAQVTALTGDARWLRQPVLGRPVIDRLDDALRALYEQRFDRRQGLLLTAFTADWGDVTPTHGDQRVIYLDEGTPLVAGLYVNAYFVAAARGLAFLHERSEDAERAAFWKARADGLANVLNARLWQDSRGFYRIHLPVKAPPGFQFPFEGDRFALGGNTLAVMAGVASDAQAARVFAAAEERQARFQIPTVAGVLLPPYPAGFFRHPILKDEWSYQNGGQWDWFAGRFLAAEYTRGHTARATPQLRAIAQRVASVRGLFEWCTRAGEGRGSARYAGSAGALGGAVLGGLFGVDLSGDRFAVATRLGTQPGRVRVYQPATDTYVAYEYAPDMPGRRLVLRFASNARAGGAVRVLLPPGSDAGRVTLDGGPARHARVAVGEDQYVEVAAGPGSHRLEIALP
jgi:hypothetical protein